MIRLPTAGAVPKLQNQGRRCPACVPSGHRRHAMLGTQMPPSPCLLLNFRGAEALQPVHRAPMAHARGRTPLLAAALLAALLLTAPFARAGCASDEELESMGDQLAEARIELHGCRSELAAAKSALAALQAAGGSAQHETRLDGQVRSAI